MTVRNSPPRPFIAGSRLSGQALVGTLRRGARRAVVATASLALPAAVLVLPTAGTAAAATAPQQTTVTFTTPGETAFTVPAGVTSLSITATGAAGQNGSIPVSLGGAGATVSGTVTVPAGATTLYVNVNTGGGSGGTFGGGVGAGAGGGASDVRTCSASAPGCVLTGVPGTDPRLIVAGGGGGGGESSDVMYGPGGAGGAAGDIGQPGGTRDQGGAGGGGGTATTGGAGGDACPFAGSVGGGGGGGGTGGTGGGGAGNFGGGGGGAGWFGGGGGGGCSLVGNDGTNVYGGTGGGGGGSNRLPAGGTSGPAIGPASVSITYTPLLEPVTTYLKSRPNPSKPGESVHVVDVVCPANSGVGVPRPTGTVTFATDGTPAGTAKLRRDGGNCSVAELALKRLSTGTHTITAIYSGDATYSSNSGNPETLTQTVKQCKHRPDHKSAPHKGDGDDKCRGH
ncbi:Ig-like domain-containing protein [Streptomyces sp. LN590]|uniref:Ig-like domain-containing protein n=1 Tax=Streptomyces sp. LN590 TaxID=3112980 RepID=UPI0037137482